MSANHLKSPTAIPDEMRTFEFEKDFVGTLRCIPMAVRFKLDLSGIKLSLRQWSRLIEPERRWLLEYRCDTPVNVQFYRDTLSEFIENRTGEVAKPIASDEAVEWTSSNRVPEAVTIQSAVKRVAAPTADQWRKLTDLQRFALIKLTREGHDNDNFVPALLEFGLLPEAEAVL